MFRTPLFSLRSSPWLVAVLLVAACSTTPKNNLLGAGGGGGDDETVSAGSGSPTGCAGLAACCASIADAATRMSCTTSEQTYAGVANGDQDCSVLLTQYQAAKVCGGGSTTVTTGAGGATGSGCAALSACCAMMSDANTKQECMTSESELAMTPGGDAACAQAAMSYAAADLCAAMPGSSTGAMMTGSSTTSGVGGMTTSSSNNTATTDAASSTGSGGDIIPSTCDQAHGVTGCCGPNDEVFYCPVGASQPTVKPCVAPELCGWSAAKGYYTCVAAPGGVDPDPTFPYNCGP